MMNERKLFLGERVEVRQFEEGLRGSWHCGVVVGVTDFFRAVQYDELLSETGKSKLVESIPVSKAVEGLCLWHRLPKSYRGWIRPLPSTTSTYNCKPRLCYGLCVDAFYEDAWWEGVLFDHDELSDKRSVFFPDEGDERKFSVSKLRISREWDEYLCSWSYRGVWVLIELAKELAQDCPLSLFVKKIWSRLQVNVGFLKMISEWTCGVQDLWVRYITEVVLEIAVESSKQTLGPVPSGASRKKGRKLKILQGVGYGLRLQGQVIRKVKCNGFHIGGSHQNKKVASNIVHKQKKQSKSVLNKPKGNACLVSNLRSKEGASFVAEDARNHHLFKTRSTQKPKKTKATVQTERFITEGGNCDSHLINSMDKCNRHSKSQMTDKGKGNESTEKYDIATDLLPSERKVNEEDNCIGFVGWSGRNKEEDCSVLSQKKKQTMKRQSTRKKSESLKAKDKGFLHDSSTKNEGMTSNVQIMKNDLSVTKKRNPVTLIGHSRSVGFPTFKLRRRRQPSSVSTKQINNYLTGKRKMKKFQQANVSSKTISKGEQKELSEKFELDDKVVALRRRSLPFANFNKNVSLKDMVSRPRKRRKRCRKGSDTICTICHFGGELLLCDYCPSSYHLSCIDLKDVPKGKWFCPSCRCDLCDLRDSNNDIRPFTTICYQCLRQYHVDCLSNLGLQLPGNSTQERFCSQKCVEIFQRLHQLLGKLNPTCVEGLFWSIMQSGRNDCYITESSKVDCSNELSRALKIMHDCFEPAVEPHTNRDIVADVIFSRRSKLKRLDFHGFYTLILQKGDDYTSVATVRILGQRVAEMPLIATCFQYRRQGMCRLLVNVLENMLSELGIERLVLPAIPQLLETWKTTFGFTEMPPQERLKFLGYPFLGFQGTSMCQKFLAESTREKSRGIFDKHELLVPEISQVANSELRHHGLHYMRKRRNNDHGKENRIQNCNSQNCNLNSTFKYVYKRRRILASKDSWGV